MNKEEAAAAASRAKKGRSETNEGRDPKPRTRYSEVSCSQEPPPPDSGEEHGGDAGADLISDLPEPILGDIISLLPTKDGARTQALSSKWRDLWRSAPLNLVTDDFLPANDEAHAGLVSRILSFHRGPGRRFRVAAHLMHHRPDTVDAWLRSPALDNLQEIDFCDTALGWEVQEPSPPPASIFRFSGSLRVATIGKCHITDGIAETLRFPALKHLAIEKVRISEASLHSLISSCPALECLFVKESFGFACLRINSNSLKSIGASVQRYIIGPWPWLQELIIEDVPFLEKLLYAEGFGLRISVTAAPKLKILGCPSDWNKRSTLMFGTTVFQGLNAASLTTVVRSVKILAVSLRVFDLDKVIDLMQCFPCLEKLYVKPCRSDFSSKAIHNFWRRKHRLLLKDLDIGLKTVVLENYKGMTAQVRFASFFVMNARELEVLRLEVERKNYNDLFFAQQHMVLEMEKRASRGALLDFTTHRCHLLPIKHVCDLSTTDPFQCRC